MLRYVLGFWACFIITSCSSADTLPPLDISHIVMENGVAPDSATLKIIRLSDGQIWQSGEARLSQRFSPASTSKIPHTLIMIEDGIASPDTGFTWDGTMRFVDNWNRDQTLSSAYKYSAVWVFQDMATAQGYNTMSKWMTRLDYGNVDIGGPADLTTYWLGGPLEISVNEQVAFLTRLIRRDLPFSTQTYDAAWPIMNEYHNEDYTLYGKTGWRSDGENMDIGWYVGWVEARYDGKPEIYVFAFNMDMPGGEGREKRKAVIKAALRAIGIIPEEE